MIFPNLALWSQSDPEDAAGQIDRAIDHRNHRLVVGLSLDDHFEHVRGALVVSQGHGKYLRLRHVIDAEQALPTLLQQEFVEFIESAQACQARERETTELKRLLADLAEVQAAVVEELKCAAGKYVDRVLAVAVCDPGLWDRDFDGRPIHTPLCDANRLAELSGVSVIDAFPDRDLALGGTGKCLEALPYWILFADRHQRQSECARLLLNLDSPVNCYHLPRSDGLDATLPEIRIAPLGPNNNQASDRAVVIASLLSLASQVANESDLGNPSELQSCLASNKDTPIDSSLLSQLEQLEANQSGDSSNCNPFVIHRKLQSAAETVGLLLGQTGAGGLAESGTNSSANRSRAVEQNRSHDRVAAATFVHTAVHFVADRIQQACGSRQLPVRWTPSDSDQAATIYLIAPTTLYPMLVAELAGRLPETEIHSCQELGVEFNQVSSVAAAVLGLLHIDQMPANIPWLTKAGSQRILGRLTPGRPANYRQLLRAMADFHPAPMKLKDAI